MHQTGRNIPKTTQNIIFHWIIEITCSTSFQSIITNCMKIHLIAIYVFCTIGSKKGKFIQRRNRVHRRESCFFLVCLSFFKCWLVIKEQHKFSPAEKETLLFPFIIFSHSFLLPITRFLVVFLLSLCNCWHTLSSGHCSLGVVMLWVLESKENAFRRGWMGP